LESGQCIQASSTYKTYTVIILLIYGQWQNVWHPTCNAIKEIMDGISFIKVQLGCEGLANHR
jgi:hypothetical protein